MFGSSLFGGVGSIVANKTFKDKSPQEIRAMAMQPGMAGQMARSYIKSQNELGDFGLPEEQPVAAPSLGGKGVSKARIASIEQRLSKLEGTNTEPSSIGEVAQSVTNDFDFSGGSVIEDQTASVNPKPMMPQQEPSLLPETFEVDKSVRSFSPLSQKSIFAQFGSMEKRNEASGYKN